LYLAALAVLVSEVAVVKPFFVFPFSCLAFSLLLFSCLASLVVLVLAQAVGVVAAGMAAMVGVGKPRVCWRSPLVMSAAVCGGSMSAACVPFWTSSDFELSRLSSASISIGKPWCNLETLNAGEASAGANACDVLSELFLA